MKTKNRVSERENDTWDRTEMESRVNYILNKKLELRKKAPYSAKTNDEVEGILRKAFHKLGWTKANVSNLKRMSGGASKEQFSFTVKFENDKDNNLGRRLVLRMDPYCSIAQTCRGREAEIQNAMIGVVPVAPVIFVDPEGDILGQPGLISEFVDGVTAPTDLNLRAVSGIGSSYGEWAKKIAPQYIDCLVKIHRFNVNSISFKYFELPVAGTNQAALQQVNWWSKVWWDDCVEPVPIITLAERWLRDNAPVCNNPVVVHCDFRTGNFMFQEPSGEFTAVLDWELCHIGDYHEDLAWTAQKLFGSRDAEGNFLVCGLLPRDEFIRQYEVKSGNKVDPEILRYYEVLNAYKCAVMDLGAAVKAAQQSTNHQDLVLSWLGSAGSVFLAQLVSLIRGGDNAA
ncbi:phosphotransferase family protein [Pseudomonas borbori]|uniref:Predicted kinase, aminoglycoside phosphotransferase (APT) family n=1 Tax=Pseudomonas borbori TaxID=289003 RepID=A0A1I5XIX9_9PSED|nr:phosphotransferase family protein [Pseudomonas borbori]SFQ31922.1 Predicted kinase, aminoglycoside phosphotransferase (APT) family [Pseudomonas borbori]